MLTRKLLQHTLVFLCSIGITKAILWMIDNYRSNEAVEITVKLILMLIISLVGTLLVALVVLLTSVFFTGEFDSYFKTTSDPIIKRIINFFNRRNNIE